MTDSAGPPGSGRGPAPRGARLATTLWLILAFLVWNDFFDSYVRGGMYAYLTRTALFEQGLAARATIDDMMAPAIANGLRVASIAGAAIAAVGVGAVRWAVRRERT
jgi:hypothetical protein